MSIIFRVQQKVGILAALGGIIVSIINLINSLTLNNLLVALSEPAFFIIFIISIVTLITGLHDSSLFRVIQISLALLMGIVAILDVYNSIHGLGLIMLAVFLAFKYGFFKKKLVTKIIIMILSVFILIEVAARLQVGVGDWMTGLDAIIYLVVFLSVTYIIYQDEIKAYVQRTKEAESKTLALTAERERLVARLAEVDDQLFELTKPADLDAMGITPAEKKVLEALVLYRETENELAMRLGLSFHTVKSHFRHIRDKLGVDRREEIIDLCRNNFK